MSDYLRRVATSAARKATAVRPAGSAPALLPLSPAWLGPLPEAASSDEPFVKPSTSPEQDTVEPSSQETDAPSPLNETVVGALTQPRGAQDVRPARAANIKAPFTVQLPKTLLPLSHTQSMHTERPTKQAPPLPTQPAHPPAAAAATPAHNAQGNQQEPVEAGEQAAASPGAKARATNAAPTPPRAEEMSTSAVPPAEAELPHAPRPAASVTAAAHDALPPQPAPLVRLPPSLSDATAQRQPPRITVGRLEVLVNNHPPAAAAAHPPTPRPTSRGTEPFERRYLDRFRLRP